MTPQQFDQVQEVFLRLRSAPEQQLHAELALEEEIIRAEVISLLEADKNCGEFLVPAERKSSGAASSTVFVQKFDTAADPPKRLGPYRLLQQIGEGGYGTVFLAEQTEPIDRKVAVKLVKPGMDSKQVLARFHAERQALAMMDHPSIARVIDAGATENGSPYFVMELVKGHRIDEFCDQNELKLDERLGLFLQVCDAVHHAHQKGVIHRDLKPSNVLVAMAEAAPVAKVIDFGIAKALDTRLTQQTLFTEYGQMIGTLEYMSPEQAEMSTVDIDTRSDVYSLGVLLYQLLTGETPISKDELLRNGVFEIPRLLRETEPVTPSSRITRRQQQLSRVARNPATHGLKQLPSGDLDWIAMKALSKDRRRRYDSVIDFARDVQRFLKGDPVEAHPPSYTYKWAKFARRHRIAAITSVVVIASVLVAVVGLSVGLSQASSALGQAKEERQKAVAAQRKLSENMYSELLQSAWRATTQHDNERARHLLESCLPELRGWEWNFAQSQIRDRDHTVLRAAGQLPIRTIDVDATSCVAACVLENGNVEIWNLGLGQLSYEIKGNLDANVARFRSDGKELLVGTTKGDLVVYRTSDWKKKASKKLKLGGIYDLALSFDGQHVAASTGGAFVEMLRADSLESLSKWKLPTRASKVRFIEGRELIIAAGLDGSAYLLEPGNPKVQSAFVSEASLQEIAILDGDQIAVLSSGMAITIDVGDLDRPATDILRSRGIAAALAVDDEGITAVGCSDGSLAIKRPGEEPSIVANFGTAVRALAASTVDQAFLAALSDGRLLRVKPQESAVGWIAKTRDPITTGVLLPTTGLAISGDAEGWMRIYDIETGELQSEVRAHSAAVWSAACDAQERFIATVGDDQMLRYWDLPTLKLRFERDIAWGVRDVCVAPDATWIAAAPPADHHDAKFQEGTIGIWNAAAGECDRLLTGHDNWVMKLSSTTDGTRLVSTSENRNTRVWDTTCDETLFTISPSQQSAAEHIVFGDSENLVFLGHRDGWVTCWSMLDGSPVSAWGTFGDSITGLHVTDDQRVIATSRSSEQLRVRDFEKGQTLATFDLGVGYIQRSQFSLDGRFITVTGQDGQVLTRRISLAD